MLMERGGTGGAMFRNSRALLYAAAYFALALASSLSDWRVLLGSTSGLSIMATRSRSGIMSGPKNRASSCSDRILIAVWTGGANPETLVGTVVSFAAPSSFIHLRGLSS